jgi:hypothetical protein
VTDFGARIGRVRMKGGADLHILKTTLPTEPAGIEARAVNHLRKIASWSNDQAPLDGYMLIGMFGDGTTSVAFSLPDRLTPTLAAAWLTEIIRRDLITEREAERVFDNMFQWVEGGSAS